LRLDHLVYDNHGGCRQRSAASRPNKGDIDMHAVQLTAYGDPVEGLKFVDIPAPEAPGPKQVLIEVQFSPLNQSDLLLARASTQRAPVFQP
jgi:D-arabinose 1-dehydrogenase-like Zn-dependent alcohol dehydrogenase